MTTVCVLADPPRPGVVLPDLPSTSPLTVQEVTDLYRAMLADTFRAVESSGGELLVNYRPDESLPDWEGESSETSIRAVAEHALEDPDAARFEPQVGETFSGRAGNTATHLLESEGLTSVAIVEPTAAFLSRPDIDGAAMKLRSSAVVLGPATDGRVYYAAFADTIDYQDAWQVPAIETLAARGSDSGHDVDFLSMSPVVERGRGLADVIALLRARERAGRAVPERLRAVVDDLGLDVAAGDGMLEVVR